MASHVEREFKLRIPDARAFADLRARFGSTEAPVLQVNHFFDTLDLRLRDARIALRLRTERTTWTLALKGPRIGDDPLLSARPEEELAVDAASARAILAGERCPLGELEASPLAPAPLVRAARVRAGAAALRHLGSFENERTRVVLGIQGPSGPLVAELDRTRFPDGRIDHELELELPTGADEARVRPALEALLSSVGLGLESVPSKAARFFRILDAGE